MKENLYNIPNALTTLRLILGIVVFFLIMKEIFFIAGVVLIIAFITDVDGWVARTLKQETVFGSYYDFAVDDFITYLAFVGLLVKGRLLPAAFVSLVIVWILWFTVTMVLRKYDVKSDDWSKVVGFLNVGAVIFLLLGLPYGKELVWIAVVYCFLVTSMKLYSLLTLSIKYRR